MGLHPVEHNPPLIRKYQPIEIALAKSLQIYWPKNIIGKSIDLKITLCNHFLLVSSPLELSMMQTYVKDQ